MQVPHKRLHSETFRVFVYIKLKDDDKVFVQSLSRFERCRHGWRVGRQVSIKRGKDPEMRLTVCWRPHGGKFTEQGKSPIIDWEHNLSLNCFDDCNVLAETVYELVLKYCRVMRW